MTRIRMPLASLAGWPQMTKFARSQRRSGLAYLYLLTALPTLIALCFLTQPLHSLDEPAHFLRVVQLTNGDILPVLGNDKASTGSYAGSGTRAFADHYGRVFVKYAHIEAKTSWNELVELYNIKDGHDKGYIEHSNTTVYAPIAYASAVSVVYLVKKITDRPLVWLYAGRLANAFLGAGLTYAALSYATRGQAFMFVIALLPITLFQTAALSADSLLIPAAMALAVILGRTIDGIALSLTSCLVAIIAGAIIGLGKIAYLPLVVVTPLVAMMMRQNTKKAITYLLFGSFIIVFAWLLWSIRVSHLVFTVRQDADKNLINVEQQLLLIRAHPLVFFHALLSTLGGVELKRYAVSISGGLIGWLDIKMPFPLLNLPILLATGVVDVRARYTPSLIRALIYSFCAFCVLTVFFLLYLQWNVVGSSIIDGVQGRYFLPLLPLICVVTPSLTLSDRNVSLLNCGLAIWGVFSAMTTLVFVAIRYW